ncbi:hypothetical protein Ancab_014275 [Ancistrocladus abbreviatus]
MPVVKDSCRVYDALGNHEVQMEIDAGSPMLESIQPNDEWRSPKEVKSNSSLNEKYQCCKGGWGGPMFASGIGTRVSEIRLVEDPNKDEGLEKANENGLMTTNIEYLELQSLELFVSVEPRKENQSVPKTSIEEGRRCEPHRKKRETIIGLFGNPCETCQDR